MKVNNLRREITDFIKDFCMEVSDETVSIEDCFEYEQVIYYIPEDTSLMGEDDALLAKMLLATFPVDI